MYAMTATHDNGKYVIDPRAYRPYRFYVGFLAVWWLIWAPGTLFVTVMAFTKEPLLFVWLIVGYIGVILAPLAFLARNRQQILEVDGKALIVHGTGVRMSSIVRIQPGNLEALVYYGRNPKKIYSLTIRRRMGFAIVLAPYVHPLDKSKLLEEIASFLRAHGFTFDVVQDLDQGG
jgi:hypothetical protein